MNCLRTQHRGRIERRSCSEQQCSNRICDEAVTNPYCFYDYVQQQPNTMDDQNKGVSHTPISTTYPPLLSHFAKNITSFKSHNQDSDFPQVSFSTAPFTYVFFFITFILYTL